MTQATQTIAGTIRLAGDLAGSNNAAQPELTPTGVTAGCYVAPTITVDAKGRITNIVGGSLTAPLATTTVPGLVQIGSNINVTSGVISIPQASNTTFGVVRSGNTDEIVIAAGQIRVGDKVVRTNRVNTFERNLRYNIRTLTPANTTTADGNLGNFFSLTLDRNLTLQMNNLGVGEYTFFIIQDSTTPRSVTFGSQFVFPSTANIAVSPTAGSINIVHCVSDGTSLYSTGVRQY